MRKLVDMEGTFLEVDRKFGHKTSDATARKGTVLWKNFSEYLVRFPNNEVELLSRFITIDETCIEVKKTIDWKGKTGSKESKNSFICRPGYAAMF